jgi:hypothetical protein
MTTNAMTFVPDLLMSAKHSAMISYPKNLARITHQTHIDDIQGS